MSRTPSATLALVAITLVASGCGGSSKSTSTSSSSASAPTTTAPASTVPTTAALPTAPTVKVASGKPLARVRWIAKGEAICARLNAQLAVTVIKSETSKEMARVLPQAAAYERAELTELVKLVPPASMKRDWQRFLTDTREWGEDSAKLAIIAQAGHFAPISPLVQATKKAHEQLAHIAAHDGFKECALI